MLIALLSDTHDRTDPMAKAVQLLQSRGAEFFIHCGDVGSPAVLDYLAGLKAAFVWGNCDFDRLGLQRYAQSIGIQCLGSFGELQLAGKRLALTHGDDPALKRRLLSEQQHDYCFQGHTHVPQDTRVGKIHLINPGALHRANPKTCALLDTQADAVEFLKID
jgi:putative phosphoesterase